ncbi:uncharacterized protein LOC124152876 [Haliotis rufescens]|uniref:uncharacterized protein LOC124152876 n=1 Tax=Haliotis rufescens TaxID=6454 RepID=UPI00201F8393|nr:uncharacterized protein LOC124152876 [Haliotis rufescens]
MTSKSIILCFSRIAQQIGHGVKREFPSPHQCVLSLPGGIPYEAFDGKAHVKPWHVLNLVESGRALSFNPIPHDNRSYLDFHRLYDHYLAFIASARLEIQPEMYGYSVTKSPLRLNKELLYHGSSSTNLETRVTQSKTGLLLASCQQQTVSVSKENRRPAALPDWWKEKYSKINMTGSALRMEPSPRPSQSEISSYSLTVQPSDTDTYFHVNWTGYLKFCLEAFALFKYEKDKSANVLELYRPVKVAELSYVKECSLGDTLRVDFWSEPTSNDKLNFEITNSEDKVVLYCSVEYFSRSEL